MKVLTADQRLAKYGDPRARSTRLAVVKRQLIKPDLTLVKTFWTHRSVADAIHDAFQQACVALDEWPSDIQGYNVRTIAGSTTYSLHSWALAWDVFAVGPAVSRETVRKNPGRYDPKTGLPLMSKDWTAKVIATTGFRWGGLFSNPDPHHYECPY